VNLNTLVFTFWSNGCNNQTVIVNIRIVMLGQLLWGRLGEPQGGLFSGKILANAAILGLEKGEII